jgi:hypothetical protein
MKASKTAAPVWQEREPSRVGEGDATVPLITIVCGILLIAVSVVSFLVTGNHSITVWIPAFIGLGFVLLGALGSKEHLRKHVMHAAAALALIVVVGLTAMSAGKFKALLVGEDVERPAAVTSQLITACVCLVFEGLCVNSFIQARRRRQAQTQG